MDNREEAREFLTSRRAKISPEQAGLPAASRRRVPGLRRSEVAALADMSVEYYAKLERGNLAGVSPAALEAVARVLQLDDAERAHLLNLAHAADGTDILTRPRRRYTQGRQQLHRSLQWTLDAITAGPAVVCNGRLAILASNPLARAFYTDLFANAANQRNLARFQFLDPASRRFYPDWDLFADMAVAMLHAQAGRSPYDKDLHDLVGELSTRVDEFRTRWSARNVRRHGTGTKRFRHPSVGELTLAYESLDLASEPGLHMTVYTAEPGSPSEEGLRLLASLAATEESTPATQPSTG
ncbi:helix-turn-helix transcriptional regulator [Streptomyces sp. Caat 7-52]|uniref:helix-turn-helix transcriptional regulator n=1 Tax=Streptomyces sp. Caat 7-52 TaxID=2949637 RepID=UPI002034CEE6|nr:helix-turn-helix transcriptional regulator [Streptomyces sp. Caat 7-52]